ncbi:Putative auto-transporter adhesin, head GIN domain [Pustulibacterium marinum]|uniref:Putative auto-transporter adhesin, head GIN domain n=1 Tax=Pustulibacterium marinum TaxID=1224947 RepID=A0A1I7H4V2_9FLAO|nr:head GIN domain-containing protein [Pustulibacterium marinum]SFU55700.1 Putative auto-transporter adhesin, head GIN domain [Pustulibacterium marinum]
MKSFFTYLSLATICFLNVQCSTPWNSVRGNGNIISETRKTGSYDEISLSSSFDVTLISGDEGTITINAEENLLQYIITEVNGNSLNIYTKNGTNISSNKGVKITVPVTSIYEVSLTGSGSIKSQTTLESKDFKTLITGSGDIILPINAKSTEASVTGSGDLQLTGTTDFFEGRVTGSGDIIANDLETKDADVHVSGSGDIKVNCSNNLKASITGSGDIMYVGNPITRDFSTTGSGDISSSY